MLNSELNKTGQGILSAVSSSSRKWRSEVKSIEQIVPLIDPFQPIFVFDLDVDSWKKSEHAVYFVWDLFLIVFSL
jgi:hypothetical protein